MSVTNYEILECVAFCAGEVPFLVLDQQGMLVKSSPGAAVLEGAKLVISGQSFELRGGRWLPSIPAMFSRARSDLVAEAFFMGGSARYQLHCFPIPEGKPEIWLLRFDAVEQGVVGGRGFPLRDPESFPDAVCFHGMWTRSAAMKQLFRSLERVAESESTVLVRGESGTGKEHVARAVHELSGRAKKPLVAVNCAALTPSLLESELFGHVRGAFTGAIKSRKGLFEQADTGSVFLDEVAEMPLELQSKLLRVLEEKKVTPVGGSQSRQVDVRIISATHCSLRAAVADKRFREDLMYRLRVVPIFIPPLRERRGDIELLVSVFVKEQKRRGRLGFERIAPEAMRALLDYPWPGNVRELSNAVEYACVVGESKTLSLADLPPEFREGDIRRPIQSQGARPVAAPKIQLATEVQRIVEALRDAAGNKSRAAKALGMHRTTLWRKMEKYDLV